MESNFRLTLLNKVLFSFYGFFFFFDNLCKLLRGAASHNENLLRIDSRRENVKSLLLTLIIID